MEQAKTSIKFTLESLEEYLKGEGSRLPKRMRDKVANAVAKLRKRLYGKADC